MAKRFKLRFSVPSFQLCRSMNRPCTSPICPLPVAASSTTPSYLFSPINPKALEIAYPISPDPPPTTPTTNHRNPFSKFRTCNSPTSFDISPPPKQKREVHNIRISSFDSSEESDSLVFSSSTTISRGFDASSVSNFSVNNGDGIKKKSKNAKARKLKRYASNNSKLILGGEADSKSVFRRLMPPCAVEGKVKESFAIVTKSEDPYEDFKRSMLEMILEKQMFEAKELEQLLQCFLSLNSRHHHPVIVAAFTEIWEVLFL